MELILSQVLTPMEITRAEHLITSATWEDGRQSAGMQARNVKRNLQLKRSSKEHKEIRDLVIAGLKRHPNFFSATLARKVLEPRINRYDSQHPAYGKHIDNALRQSDAQTDEYIRTDISCTVFLNSPDHYQGGELVFEQGSCKRQIKLAAGDGVLYQGNTLHEVTPVTHGHRHACFLWIQSFVRSEAQRAMLYDLDSTIINLRKKNGDATEVTRLVGLYHNLLREWAET